MKSELKRILVLEDNFDHAELITSVIENNFSPVDIHTVDRLENCLEFLSETRYDLVLIDCFIQNELITESVAKICIRAGKAPVIVITGSGDERLAADVIKSGASDYLVKSADSLSHLPKLIAKHLGSSKQRSSKKDQKNNSDYAKRLLSEVDTLTEKTKRITSLSSSPADLRQLKQIFDQIHKLRDLANKILHK